MKKHFEKVDFEDLIAWVGSTQSLLLHTIFFALSFVLVLFRILDLDTMLLILTTVVSLEAIYLAIFIQMSVNRNTVSLREVEEDIDEIEEELEEMTEDDREVEERDMAQAERLEELTTQVKDILETIKKLQR